MDFSPPFRTDQFERLEAGELFFIEYDNFHAVAIKVKDAGIEGQNLMALLGPDVPAKYGTGRLIKGQRTAVVRIGLDYKIMLPTTPKGWTQQAPGANVLALALRNDTLSIRINLDNRPGKFNPGYLRLPGGTIDFQNANNAALFASQWEIALAAGKQDARSVLRVGF